MIKLRNFGIEYDDKKIFNPFDYDFNETGFTILVGPSGCGKSSLLKSLINQNIYSGAIFYNDNNINEMDFSLFFKNNISYISHDDNLFYYNTAKENILLSIHNLNNDLYNYYIDRYNMSSFINKKINELSLGQRQLVLLVSIFLQPKPYIFLDEALCNLDYDNIHIPNTVCSDSFLKFLPGTVDTRPSYKKEYRHVLITLVYRISIFALYLVYIALFQEFQSK